jgi:hypothetical protein
MARRRARVGARSARRGANGVRTINRARVSDGGVDANMIPRVLVGVVEGLEIVVVGTLQFARNVLLSAVTGTANIVTEALKATTGGARGVVSEAVQMVGNVAATAQGTVQATFDEARRSWRAPVRLRPRPPAALTEQAGERGRPVRPLKTSRSRRQVRRLRPVTGPSRTSTAA